MLSIQRSLAKLALNLLRRESLIRIYSHPRSGTHFLEKFVGLNFYPNLDLEQKPIEWGHWSNRQVNKEGYAYQKLFGNHFFPPKGYNLEGKCIYIVRDPRAVAYSIWNTPGFLNIKDSRLSFSEFIRAKLDWNGSPAFKAVPKLNIAQHWGYHVANWTKHSIRRKNILIVRYEDLKLQPEKVYLDILRRFFQFSFIKQKFSPSKVKEVKEKTGLLPNAASVDAWKSIFTSEDELFFISQIKHKAFLDRHLGYQLNDPKKR